jgi:acetyl esterase/lipase
MKHEKGWTLDPALFDPQQVPALTQAFNAQAEALLATIPSILQLPPAVIREARASGRSVLGPVVLSPKGETRMLVTPQGALPLRVFPTPGARGVLLHIHGGGMALGSHDQQDFLLEPIADATGLAIVSVGYRLAPEHPYPAGPDDCERAALWLTEHAQREFGTDQLYIAGESAGAYLSAVTLLRLKDRHGLRPFKGAVFTYGHYDMSHLSPSARLWGSRNLVISTPIIEQFFDWFIPPEQRHLPDASPLYGNLAGLPPALFTVGTLDPLLDDTLFMASRWIAAGNTAELALYPGAIHGFTLFPYAQGLAANQRIVQFLKDRISAVVAENAGD